MKILLVHKPDDGSLMFKMPSGWVVVAVRPYTNEPADNYLSLLLAFSDEKKEWVTWVYNHETGGCEHGNYFSKWNSAFNDFLNRRVERPNDEAVNNLIKACEEIVERWDFGMAAYPCSGVVAPLRKALAEVKEAK